MSYKSIEEIQLRKKVLSELMKETHEQFNKRVNESKSSLKSATTKWAIPTVLTAAVGYFTNSFIQKSDLFEKEKSVTTQTTEKKNNIHLLEKVKSSIPELSDIAQKFIQEQ